MTTSAVKELNKLEPGTETLILLVYSLIRVIVLEMPEKKEQQENHERLLFYSLLEDNSYARMVFKNIFGICEKTVLDSYEIALKEGDVIESPISKENRFWFVHHLAMALNLCHQLDEPAFDYDMTQEELAEEASLFCLRGIGMKDEVIKTYFKPSRLKIFLKGLYSG